MDILNEVVTGRTRQTRHLKSHHLQGGRAEVDLLEGVAARPSRMAVACQRGSLT
jgi:hypothetical protein